jgi:hypothetical protein
MQACPCLRGRCRQAIRHHSQSGGCVAAIGRNGPTAVGTPSEVRHLFSMKPVAGFAIGLGFRSDSRWARSTFRRRSCERNPRQKISPMTRATPIQRFLTGPHGVRRRARYDSNHRSNRLIFQAYLANRKSRNHSIRIMQPLGAGPCAVREMRGSTAPRSPENCKQIMNPSTSRV